MAFLEKIRVKLGVFISIVIALALLSFLIDPTSLQNVLSSMSKKYNVGEINGKSISYNDFNEKVEELNLINQIVSGSTLKDEETMAAARSAAWQSMIDKYLLFKESAAAGLTVGNAELLDLTTGSMVSPIITQTGVFSDESGYFSKENLVSFVKSIDYDTSGNSKAFWDYLVDAVYTQQFYSKYGSLFTSGSYTNPLMLAKAIEENNNTTDVEFVVVPVGYTRDTTIVVTDKEIRDYYNLHKNQYKQDASRDIEYVVFEVVPSEADIQNATEETNLLHDEMAETDNMRSFLLRNSDRSLSDYYYRAGELNTVSRDINDFVFGEKSDGISPLYLADNVFYAAKVLDTKMMPDSVYVRHILLQDNQELADSLLTELKKGANFSVMALNYSADTNTSVPEIGDLGWMTQTYMIPGMEEVMFAKVGEPFIMETQYGRHIVEVTKRTSLIEKKQVAILQREILPSKATYNEIYGQANEFAVRANGKYDSYKEAVSEMGVYSHTINGMLESSSSLGGISGTKEVTRWVFDAKEGKASSIITVNNNYFFVAALKGIHKEGYATVQEVASTIQSNLYTEKALEKKRGEVEQTIAGLGSMQAIADALSTAVSTSENVTFAALGSQSQRFDYKFIGAVSVAEPGVISEPFIGDAGVYVFRVKAHDTGAYYTEDDARLHEEEMAQANLRLLMPVMMDDAGVIDNRARFF